MEIPERYRTQEFWLSVIKMAKRRLDELQFPKCRYDDDIYTLIEDVIQDVYTRIVEKVEPDPPIVNWPGYFNAVMYYVILERRGSAFKAHEAGREKVSGTVTLEDDDQAVAVETQVADRTILIDQLLANPEMDPVWEAVEDPRFWQFIDDELPKVTDERCRECFRRFAELVWRKGLSRREAWRQVRPTCHGDRWATFNRWLNRLTVALWNRWLAR